VFDTTPSGSLNSLTRMVIKNDGKVGMGTIGSRNPAGMFEVYQDDPRNQEEERIGGFIKSYNGGIQQWLSFYLFPPNTSRNAYLASTSMIYASDDPPENLALAAASKTNHIRFNVGGYSSADSEVMRLVNPGGESSPDPRVGIGTATPSRTLDVKGTAGSSGGAWAGSDRRWKKDIVTLENPLDKIMRLRGVKFNWKRQEFKENHFPAGRQIGLIAQEVEKEFPELVLTDEQGYKSLAYEKLTAVLLEAVKEQQLEIESLKKEIEIIKSRK
jgi:hypothetical protein